MQEKWGNEITPGNGLPRDNEWNCTEVIEWNHWTECRMSQQICHWSLSLINIAITFWCWYHFCEIFSFHYNIRHYQHLSLTLILFTVIDMTLPLIICHWLILACWLGCLIYFPLFAPMALPMPHCHCHFSAITYFIIAIAIITTCH